MIYDHETRRARSLISSPRLLSSSGAPLDSSGGTDPQVEIPAAFWAHLAAYGYHDLEAQEIGEEILNQIDIQNMNKTNVLHEMFNVFM